MPKNRHMRFIIEILYIILTLLRRNLPYSSGVVLFTLTRVHGS